MPVSFVALYGRFSAKMKPVSVKNVSNALLPFITDNILLLPRQKRLDSLFPNKMKGRKFLQIRLADGKRINVLDDTYQFDVQVNLSSNEKSICIIYAVFINPKSNWRAIISGQLADIKSYGLLHEAELYIHVTNVQHTKGVLPFIRRKAGADAVIQQSFTNQFEYPAIKLLYDCAMQYPGKTYLYFHTKGMSYDIQKRRRQERALTAGTFEHWRKNMEGFQDASVNKVGLFPAEVFPDSGGWVWYNYFMARGTYITQCDDPLITDKRHYYESWLGKNGGVTKMDDGYSSFTGRKENFSPQEADQNLATVTENYIAQRKTKSIIYRLGFPWFKRKR